jgi:hypothetical protein
MHRHTDNRAEARHDPQILLGYPKEFWGWAPGRFVKQFRGL